MSHTPGPWHVDGIHIGDSQRLIVGSVGRHGGPENAANARLMAAAPDLLESLKGVLYQFDSGSSDSWRSPRCVVRAQALIAKIEGTL